MVHKKSSKLGGLLHLAGFGIFSYAFYYDINSVIIPGEKFPGKAKYLTVWNLVIQALFHGLSILNDIAGSNELSPNKVTALQKIRDIYFASWVFPTGTFVSLSFWTLYAIDRNLVFPAELDEFYPSWLNHVAHTGPILLLSFESYLVPKIFPSKLTGSLANIFLTSIYGSWIIWVNEVYGVWAYPVLRVLDNTQRAIFILGAVLFIFSFYFLGEALNSWFWKPIESKGAKSKSNKGNSSGSGGGGGKKGSKKLK